MSAATTRPKPASSSRSAGTAGVVVLAVVVDYCDLSKFPSCCEHVDVFCLFETLECWLECCAQLCSDTGVSSFVFAW